MIALARQSKTGTWLLLPLLVLSLSRTSLGAAASDTAESRWNAMSDQDKQRVRENYKRWSSMPPEERETLRNNYSRFRKLSEGERALVLKRYHRFKALPPERQDRIRERFQKFMQLSPQERAKRVQQVRERRMNNAPVREETRTPRAPNRQPPARRNFRGRRK